MWWDLVNALKYFPEQTACLSEIPVDFIWMKPHKMQNIEAVQRVLQEKGELSFSSASM